MIETIQKDAEIKLRIREIVKSRGGNASKLARQMNIKEPYFASILNSHDKGVSATLLKAFAGIGINITWLLTGEGNMSLSDETGRSWKERALSAEKLIHENNTHIDNLNFLIKNLERMIQNQ